MASAPVDEKVFFDISEITHKAGNILYIKKTKHGTEFRAHVFLLQSIKQQ